MPGLPQPDLEVDDDEWVIRGGVSPDDRLVIGAEVHEADHPGEWAVSGAALRGHTPEEIAAKCPHLRNTWITAGFAGELREAGFDVYSDGRPHVNIVFPEKPQEGDDQCARLRAALSTQVPNPNLTA